MNGEHTPPKNGNGRASKVVAWAAAGGVVSGSGALWWLQNNERRLATVEEQVKWIVQVGQDRTNRIETLLEKLENQLEERSK